MPRFSSRCCDCMCVVRCITVYFVNVQCTCVYKTVHRSRSSNIIIRTFWLLLVLLLMIFAFGSWNLYTVIGSQVLTRNGIFQLMLIFSHYDQLEVRGDNSLSLSLQNPLDPPNCPNILDEEQVCHTKFFDWTASSARKCIFSKVPNRVFWYLRGTRTSTQCHKGFFYKCFFYAFETFMGISNIHQI